MSLISWTNRRSWVTSGVFFWGPPLPTKEHDTNVPMGQGQPFVKIKVKYQHKRDLSELRILGSPGMVVVDSGGNAFQGSLSRVSCSWDLAPDECASWRCFGMQPMMQIHLGAWKIHAVPWQIVSRDLPDLYSSHFQNCYCYWWGKPT